MREAAMRRLGVVLAVALASLALGSAGAIAQTQPKTAVVNIVNETPSRVYYRVKLWQRDYSFVMAGRTAAVTVPLENSKLSTVEVEVYMRDPRDKCFASVPINGSVVVTDADVKIDCKAKR
jgi:hypothetical protein